MEKKPAEVVPQVLRIAAGPGKKQRRPAFEFLIDVDPPTPEINELLWKGLYDKDFQIPDMCFAALRKRSNDKQRWVPALKKIVQGEISIRGGKIAALAMLFDFDPAAARSSLPVVLTFVTQPDSPGLMAQAAMLDKHLLPILPKAWKFLSDSNPQVRHNVLTLLYCLPSEHTRAVEQKVWAALKDVQPANKLMAAKVLLRLNPTDKGPIAQALAEVPGQTKKATLKQAYDGEALQILMGLGGEAKAAVPTLRAALNTPNADLKARILVTLAAIDSGSRSDLLTSANQMFQGTKDDEKWAGASALVYLDAHNTEQALDLLRRSLEKPAVLGLVEWVGPKAKALAPALQALEEDPFHLFPVPVAMALGKVNGDPQATVTKLVDILKNEPSQINAVMRALGRLGPAARPALPTIVELGRGRVGLMPGDIDDLIRIDPAAVKVVMER
jgi:hypothetical protein